MPTGVYIRTEEMIKNMKGRHPSKETLIKLSESHKGKIPWCKGKKLSEATREKLSLIHLGHKVSNETREKISKANSGENNGMFGKHPSKETIEKHRLSRLGKPRSEETKMKISKTTEEQWKNEKYRKEHTAHWNNPEFKNQLIKNILKGLLVRPTSFEQKVSDLCFKHNLPFIYEGDGGFLINYKNPDFVNEKDKIVIEVFYSWFKIRDYGSVENYKEFCRNKYGPAGWKVIFIDETEINVDNWEQICLNKILNAMEVSNN